MLMHENYIGKKSKETKMRRFFIILMKINTTEISRETFFHKGQEKLKFNQLYDETEARKNYTTKKKEEEERKLM